jgi:hypothetical protein
MDAAARDTCFLRECLVDRCERAVEVGSGDHTCALLTTPRMACWGDGRNGQFAAGGADRMVAAIYPLPAAGIEIAAAQNSLCYRDVTGDASTVDVTTPVRIAIP